MHRGLTSLVICLLATFVVAAPALAEGDGADLFAQAQASLSKADFEGAAALMEKAAAADPDNEKYAHELRLLQRVIKFRARFDTNATHAKWERTARSLRSYYYLHKIYGEALVIDKLCHEKLKNADTAARLGRTMLMMDKNEEAAQFLGSLSDDQKSDCNATLCGIALARLGKTDEAGKIAAGLKELKDTTPLQFYERARLNSLLGQQEDASKLLVIAFEKMPPSMLGEFKQLVKDTSDLAGFFKTPAAAKVMATESKMPQSSCSGGSSCGKCPSRGKCSKPSSKESCDDKDKEEQGKEGSEKKD